MAFWHNSELPRCKGRIDSIALTLYAPALCIYVNAYSPPSEASATPARAHAHKHTYSRSFPRAPDSPLAFLSRRGEAGQAHLLSRRLQPADGKLLHKLYPVRRRRYIIRVHVAIRTSFSPLLSSLRRPDDLCVSRYACVVRPCAWNLRTHT